MFYLQFLLAAAIVLTANWQPPDLIPLVASVPGIAIAVWGWLAIGLKNIQVHARATQSTRLVTDGPYRWIRHPMYSGQLWFTAALLASNCQWYRVACWIGLLMVLWLKSKQEEQGLREMFPEYEAYQKRTKRLLPGLI